LRSRMRCLRMPFLCRKQNQIDATVHTAAIIHNMLLQNDGLAQRFDDIDESFNWHDVEADVEDPEDGWRAVHHNGDVVGPMDDYGGVGLRMDRTVGAELEAGYFSFREKLVQHVHFLSRNGRLQHNH